MVRIQLGWDTHHMPYRRAFGIVEIRRCKGVVGLWNISYRQSSTVF
jgi:hypothetical protein